MTDHKYQTGDKVVIKTWEAMVKEFGLQRSGNGGIDCDVGYVQGMEDTLNGLSKKRVLTISIAHGKGIYSIKHDKKEWVWSGDMISRAHRFHISKKDEDRINNRFQILDL